MRKKMYILSAGLVLLLSLCTSGAWGEVITYPDNTYIEKWIGGSPPSPTGIWLDVWGERKFNTYYATYDTSSHYLTIFTNWSENATDVSQGTPSITFVAADLFLDFNRDGNWDAGIPLHGDDKGKVFYISSPSDYLTSKQVVGTNTAVSYGGLYTTNKAPLPGPPSFDVPVIVTATVSLDTAAVTWADLGNNGDVLSDPDFSVAINLSNVDNGFNPDDLCFLWGTTTCGNDVILPLPPSLLLFGSGLLGLVGLRRLRKI